MNLLEQQLKDLQTKKEKITYLKEVIQALELLGKPDEGNEPATEARGQVIAELTEFITNQVAAIESGNTIQIVPTTQTSVGQFSEDDVATLKMVISRTRAKYQESLNTNTFANEDITVPPKVVIPAKKPKTTDMIRFAMENKHLERKRVIVHSKNGDVRGIVVGLLAPNVIVQTETGHEVPVDLENITVE